MQSVDLNTDFTENTNSTIFENSPECHLDEVAALRQQVADLNQIIVDLENTIQLKDKQLENLHRDKERLSSELKKQQRCNRNLKQQLDDERFFYQKEKEHFCEEMQIHKAKCLGSTSRAQQHQYQEFEKVRDYLEDENKQLKDELSEKSEITYNLCIKFLRMKHAKDTLRKKLDQLFREHLQVMGEMMEKLDEAREELNIIVSEKFQQPLHMSKAKFLQVVQRNSRLVHENATLKLQIQQLMQNIEKLKSDTQKSRTINVDSGTIAKLTMRCRKKDSDDTAKETSTSQENLIPPNKAYLRKVEKLMSTSKFTNTDANLAMDHSGDAKMPLKVRTKKWSKFAISETRESSEKAMELRKERTQSAPEIVQSVIAQQDQNSEISMESTDISQRSVEVRDVYTNT